ncbi:MAG: DMT family transporter, partial [Rhodobacteraceae bacterium]|nr:DMT family transporter [Paracoccaceae bacterium]
MDLRALAMGLAFALMWSSAFTSARVIVLEMPPILSLAARFVISGGVAVIWAAALGQSARLNAAQWRGTIIFGICQNALYLGLFFLAMQRIEAGLAAIIASTMPLLVAVANRAVFKERLPWLGVAGLVAGFAGVALILGDRLSAGVDLMGLGYAAVGVLAL